MRTKVIVRVVASIRDVGRTGAPTGIDDGVGWGFHVVEVVVLLNPIVDAKLAAMVNRILTQPVSRALTRLRSRTRHRGNFAAGQ